MTDAGANSRRHWVWKYLLPAVVACVFLLGGLAWYVTTDSFQAMVRRRLVTELERITGGRVELGSFHTTPLRLRVEVRDLTIHGREQPREIPYAHVERVVAEVKIISVLGAEFGFHSLLLDHPVIHLIAYPDGSTNQPTPKIKQASSEIPVEQLFRLSISRLEIRRGELLWNDEKLPLDFVVNDVSADMTYSLLRRRYVSNLLLGKAVTTFQDYRPVAWMAEVHFTLGAHGLEIESLKATSGRSHLTAGGRLADFRRPYVDVTYDAKLDATEVGAIARRPELRGGMVEIQGTGSWSAEQFSSNGRLLLRDFAWHDRSVNLTDANLSTQFSVTPQRVTISQLQARLLGGTIAGEAEVRGWLNAAHGVKLAKAKRVEEQQGTILLRLKDLSAGALANAFSTPVLPLRRMNVAGADSGTVEARWKGSFHDAEVSLALDVAPPSSPSPNQLPLNARARATYHAASGELEVAEFSASTRASQVHASGRLASTGALRFSASTTDLNEWQPILAAFGKPEQIPATLQGRAAFNGTATGKLPGVTIAGNLQAQDFDYLIPASARTPAQQVHWDALTTDVQLSRHLFAAHNGTLQHGDTAINFDVTIGLDHGKFTEQSSFSARVNMRNAEIAEMLALAGYSYPVRGTMNLSVQASGTHAHPEGGGLFELSDASVYGESVQRLNADLRFGAGEVQLSDIRISYYDAQATGTAKYNLSTRAFRFDLNGTNFDLAHLPRGWNAGPGMQGRMDFTAQGSGTPEAPTINTTLHAHSLIYGQEQLGDFTLEAVTRGPELRITGHSQFQQAELALEGDVQLRGDWPSTVDLHFEHFDADALLRSYWQAPTTAHAVIAGDLHLQGPLRQPRDLSLTGSLKDLNVNVENVSLRNDGPIRFSVSSQLLRVEPFHLVGEDTDFSGNGTMQLSGERLLDLRAQGQINLKLLESFDSAFTSSGMASVDIAVSGPLTQPITQGRVQVTNGAIAYSDLPSALSEINGSLLFNQDRLQVETLTARSGGGQVTFGGSATWYKRQLNFDLTLQEREVRLRYPPGVSSTANADLHFVGSSAASALSGDVTITRISVTPGFDFGAYLARSARATALPPTDPLLNRIRLDVHIVTTPELQMQTAVVRLSGDADLRLRGTAAKPVILGRADVLEGQVYFNGTKYELERGEVAFTSPVTTTPVLDLQATTHVRDYDITLILNGEPDKLKVTYRSEPPLPEADIIALLALGRTTEESGQLQQSGQASFTQDASSAIINQALNATVSNRAQRLFGVSRIKIDPEGLSTETNLGRGPLVTIEQQVADNLTMTYSTSVEQASQQIIQVVYNLSRNISIVAIRDQNGVVSFDVRIRSRKR